MNRGTKLISRSRSAFVVLMTYVVVHPLALRVSTAPFTSVEAQRNLIIENLLRHNARERHEHGHDLNAPMDDSSEPDEHEHDHFHAHGVGSSSSNDRHPHLSDFQPSQQDLEDFEQAARMSDQEFQAAEKERAKVVGPWRQLDDPVFWGSRVLLGRYLFFVFLARSFKMLPHDVVKIIAEMDGRPRLKPSENLINLIIKEFFMPKEWYARDPRTGHRSLNKVGTEFLSFQQMADHHRGSPAGDSAFSQVVKMLPRMRFAPILFHVLQSFKLLHGSFSIDDVMYLLINGGDANAQDQMVRWSPLHWACFEPANINLVRLLLYHGADVTAIVPNELTLPILFLDLGSQLNPGAGKKPAELCRDINIRRLLFRHEYRQNELRIGNMNHFLAEERKRRRSKEVLSSRGSSQSNAEELMEIEAYPISELANYRREEAYPVCVCTSV